MTTKEKSAKKDFVLVAFGVFQQASGKVLAPDGIKGKKADSRKGGLKGGKTRMESLTEEQRHDLRGEQHQLDVSGYSRL